jgi:hypothetical protein
MTTKFEPAPTYADPVLVDEVSGKSKFNPLWLKWFLSVVQVFDSLLAQSVNGVVNHEALSGLLGGGSNAHFHITAAQQAAVAAGITVTITTAKLTVVGATGSMTFTNGILTAQTAAT